MVAMGTTNYVVMIDPASFIDVIPYSSWRIDAAIVGNVHNIVITSSDEIARGIITRLQEKTGEHVESNGIIYNIQPFPEMNISIITWASTQLMQKAGIARSLLAACWAVNWPVGGNVCVTNFTSGSVSALPFARCH